MHTLEQSPVPKHFALSNVDVWNESGIAKSQDVLIENGTVTQIRSHGAQLIPENFVIRMCNGEALIPAGVDAQVHLRVPGQPLKELPETGLMAAAAGGFGAILTMPNTQPVIDDVRSLELGRNEARVAEKKIGVKVLWSAAVTKGQNSQELADLEALAKAGVSAFTDDGKGVARTELMRDAFARLEALGLPLLQHAEMPGHGGVLAPGKTQREQNIPAYSAEQEWRMVERDLEVLKSFPRARYHVLHVSSAKTVELVTQARKQGLKVSAEVSPHHLYFTADDIPGGQTSFKMNPPVRSADDRVALIKALENGDLDFVATDHAPHEPEKKTADFNAAAFGTTGLETCLRVLLDLHYRGKLQAQRLVQVFSTAPARFLGVSDTFGSIQTGRPFSAVLVNTKTAPHKVVADDLFSLSKNNCFLGEPLAGEILERYIGDSIYR